MWRQSSLLICPLLLVSTYAIEGDKDYSNREAMLLTIQYRIELQTSNVPDWEKRLNIYIHK